MLFERFKELWSKLTETEKTMVFMPPFIFFMGMYALYYNALEFGLLYAVGGAFLMGYSAGYFLTAYF